MVLDIGVRNNWVPLFGALSTQAAKAEMSKTFRRRAADANYRIVRNLTLVSPTNAQIEHDVDLHSKKKGFIIRPAAMEKARNMMYPKVGKPGKSVPIAERSEITRIENQIGRLTEEIKQLTSEAKDYRKKLNRLDAQKRRLRTYNMRSAVKHPFSEYKMLVTRRTEVEDAFSKKMLNVQSLKRIRTRLKISKTGIYPKASNKPNVTISGQLVTLHDLAVECEKRARLGAIHGTLKLFRMVEKQLKGRVLDASWTKADHPSTRGETGYEFHVTDHGYICTYTSPAFGADVGVVQHVTSDRWEERKNQLAIELGFQASEKELVERVKESLLKLINS
jgi:hypothetical protein